MPKSSKNWEMQYKCPQCDFTSDQPGTCPVHNVALVEVTSETTPSPEGAAE